MRRRLVRPILVAATAVALLTTAWLCRAAEKMPECELIRDPDFRRGFTVLQPEPGKRVPYGILREHETTAEPVWDLVQWSSKHRLTIAAPEPLADGSLRYSNVAKTVTLGAAGADSNTGVGCLKAADQTEALGAFAGPGGWNDPDMLTVGMQQQEKKYQATFNGKQLPIKTAVEDRSHFSLWCLLNAPLLY